MVKTESEKDFQDRFRREEIIPLKGLDTPEKLQIALKRGMKNVSSKQMTLALESMNYTIEVKYKIPKRVRRSHKRYYSYHGRPARSVGRETREEIITDYKGNEMLRYRDYKTGRFTSHPSKKKKDKDKNPEKVN